MKGLLEKVISEGGGSKAQIPGYRVAGKTGTAQKVENGAYKPGEYIASFVGFAPVENPRLAVIVVIDNPSGSSYYGGQVAAPVAKKILHESMRYLNILPNETATTELPRNERQTPKAMPSVKEKKGLVMVPDVGRPYDDTGRYGYRGQPRYHAAFVGAGRLGGARPI